MLLGFGDSCCICCRNLCSQRTSSREGSPVRHLPRYSRYRIELHPIKNPFTQVTDFADFLTSDPTEAQITEWVKGICRTLGEVRNIQKSVKTCSKLNLEDPQPT